MISHYDKRIGVAVYQQCEFESYTGKKNTFSLKQYNLHTFGLNRSFINIIKKQQLGFLWNKVGHTELYLKSSIFLSLLTLNVIKKLSVLIVFTL
jgi:hypothetical protein